MLGNRNIKKEIRRDASIRAPGDERPMENRRGSEVRESLDADRREGNSDPTSLVSSRLPRDARPLVDDSCVGKGGALRKGGEVRIISSGTRSLFSVNLEKWNNNTGHDDSPVAERRQSGV